MRRVAEHSNGGRYRDRTYGPYHVKVRGSEKNEADRGFFQRIGLERDTNGHRTSENVSPPLAHPARRVSSAGRACCPWSNCLHLGSPKTANPAIRSGRRGMLDWFVEVTWLG